MKQFVLQPKAALLLTVFVFQGLSGTQVERGNGVWFTGKGCGVTTEIKYLKDIPDDTKDLECTFIPKKNMILRNVNEPSKPSKTIAECIQEKTINSGTGLKQENVGTMEECVQLCIDDENCVGVNGQQRPFFLTCKLLQDLGVTTSDNFHTFVAKACFA